MPDPHIRILTAVARHNQRRLDAHDDALFGLPDEASVERRVDLADRASKTRDRVAAGRARRRQGHPS